MIALTNPLYIFYSNTINNNISVISVTNGVYIAVNKQNEILLNILNKKIENFVNTDEYQKLITKWFVNYQFDKNKDKHIIKKLFIINAFYILILFIIIVLSLSFIIFLKNQMRKQVLLLKEKNNELELQYKKLLEQNNEFQKLNSMKDNFLSNISHELRTPLVALQGYTELLLNDKIDKLTEKQYLAVNAISASIAKLTAMINNIIENIKDENKLNKLQKMPIDLVELIESLIKTYYSMLQNKSIKLKFEYNSSEKYIITTNDTMIYCIISNLFSNAIKYNKTDGNIFIRLTKSEKFIILTIEDTGIGIPKNEIDKIFDKFYQIDNKITTNSGGLGLGLFLVKKYCLLLGYEIKVESEVNKGSEFILKFSLTE